MGCVSPDGAEFAACRAGSLLAPRKCDFWCGPRGLARAADDGAADELVLRRKAPPTCSSPSSPPRTGTALRRLAARRGSARSRPPSPAFSGRAARLGDPRRSRRAARVARVQLDVFMPPPDGPSLVRCSPRCSRRTICSCASRCGSGWRTTWASASSRARRSSSRRRRWTRGRRRRRVGGVGGERRVRRADVERIVGTVDLSCRSSSCRRTASPTRTLPLAHGGRRRVPEARARAAALRAAEARAVAPAPRRSTCVGARTGRAQLYRAEEYNTLPESPVYTSFTSAPLKLQHREPLLLRNRGYVFISRLARQPAHRRRLDRRRVVVVVVVVVGRLDGRLARAAAWISSTCACSCRRRR